MKTLFVIFACTVIAAQAIFAQNFQWERVPQLDTAIIVRAFALQGQYLFMGADHYGLHRTSDYGNTWESTAIASNLTVEALFVSDEYLFAGVAGIYRSDNFGNSWENVGGNDVANSFGKFGSYLFAGHKINSVRRSSNGGKTWKSGFGIGGAIAFCQADSFILNANPDFGVMRSIDTGKNWNYGSFKDPLLTLYNGNGVLLAGATEEGVYRSTNSGVSWGVYNIGIVGGNATGVSVYTFHAVGQYLYAGSSEGVFYSTNNGALWKKSESTGLTDTIVKLLYSHGPYLFAGTNHGVFRAKLPSVGVQEEQSLFSVSISPNPAAESFIVHYSDNAAIIIRDVLGRIALTGVSGESFSTSDLSAGVYFVEALAGDRRRIGKLIVAR